MLVLNRKKGESINIGEDIEVTVIDIQGDSVKLGIAAPLTVRVYRQEIYREIMLSNRQATEHLDKIDDKIKILQQLAREGE